jgi:hypothetical protein
MRFLRLTGGFAPYNLSGFGCGASPVPTFATGSVGLLVLAGRLLGLSGASAATVPVGAAFDAGGETGAGATVGGRVPAFGGATFFVVRAGGRFALTFAFGFGRTCFRATAFFFALIAVVFGRLFAADLARRSFALVLPLALAAFLTFALLAIVSSPPRCVMNEITGSGARLRATIDVLLRRVAISNDNLQGGSGLQA